MVISKFRKNIILALGFILFIASLLAFNQEKEKLSPLEFRMEVKLLQIEVHVYGKKNEFVSGLTKDDFILWEDGQLQEIRYVDEINLDGVQYEPKTAEPVLLRQPSKPLNCIIFIFDKGHISQASAKRIKDAVKKFIDKNIKSNTLLAAFTLDNWGAYQMIHEFSNSPQEILSTLDLQTLSSAAVDSRPSKIQNIQRLLCIGIIDPESFNRVNLCENYWPGNPCPKALFRWITSMAKPYVLEEQQLSSNIARSLTTIFGFLKHVPGQKNVLFFSEGFDPTGSYYHAFLSDTIQKCSNLNEIYPLISILKDDSRVNMMNDLVIYANASGLTFNWLNPQNPDFLFGADSEIHPEVASGVYLNQVFSQLKRLTDDTGGFWMQTGFYFEDFFSKMNQNLTHYYIISYAPKKHSMDNKAHKIKIRIDKPNMKAIARKSITHFSPEDLIDTMLASALDFPDLYNQIAASADYIYFMDNKNKITSTISIAVPLSELTSVNESENFLDELHFAYLVKNDKGEIVSREHKVANINLPLDQFNELVKDNSAFQNLHSFQLKPGAYILYAAVADAGGWKITGWKIPLKIALGEKNCFSLSPLLIASKIETIESLQNSKARHSVIMQSDGGIIYKDKKITFSPIRNLSPSGQIVGMYQIFNAKINRGSKASIHVSFKLFDETNTLISSLPQKEITDYTDKANNLITNFFILPYKNLVANNYKLILEARDLESNCSAESITHFAIKQQ